MPKAENHQMTRYTPFNSLRSLTVTGPEPLSRVWWLRPRPFLHAAERGWAEAVPGLNKWHLYTNWFCSRTLARLWVILQRGGDEVTARNAQFTPSSPLTWPPLSGRKGPSRASPVTASYSDWHFRIPAGQGPWRSAKLSSSAQVCIIARELLQHCMSASWTVASMLYTQ